MTDQELFRRMDDVAAAGLTAWGEGRGESLDGRAGILWTIRRRVEDSRWPTTYRAVCLQPKQYSCWNPGRDANAQAVRSVAVALIEHGIAEAKLRECLWLAQGIMDDVVCDPVRGANHYVTDKLYRLARPRWASAMPVVARIGGHVFLRG